MAQVSYSIIVSINVIKIAFNISYINLRGSIGVRLGIGFFLRLGIYIDIAIDNSVIKVI